LPSIFFDKAPVVADDALATGTKYDAMLKLGDNTFGYAIAILLNDPNSSFFEYMGTHAGYDWQKIIGDLGAAAASFASEEVLI
jgi:deoxyxylulose-5-phosphate synthase